MTLHDQLQQLAETAPRPAIDHDVWDRGRALRRRDRVVTSAVALAMVVILGGLVAVVNGPPRAFAPAGETVPEGAIPSRIYDVPTDVALPLEEDLAIGQGSVSFVSGFGYPVVIGATDGRYHRLDLPGLNPGDFWPPALSPDGWQLAWGDAEASVLRLADLQTGDVREIDIAGGAYNLRWTPDGGTLLVATARRAARITVATGEVTSLRGTYVNTTGHPSPDGSLISVVGDQETDAAFVSPGDRRTLERPFPTTVYSDGVSVQLLGWTDDHLVLASAESHDEGVGGRQLVLFSSPDVPRSRWTFRIIASNRLSSALSVAVDLVPDLDGTSGQQLTHDFGKPAWPGERDISWMIGLGVAGALSVLYGLRWVWRRRTRLT